MLAMGAGTLAVLLSGVYSIQVLLNFISLERIPRPVLKLLQWFRLTASSSNEYSDLDPMVKAMIGDTTVKNKSLVDIKGLIFAFMICTVLSMWVYWYEGVYGWSALLESFELELKTLLTIFQKR
jgi:PST family polysaccharide transporter